LESCKGKTNVLPATDENTQPGACGG
jgi:hypothetical protein